jgi:adenylate cyclase
MKFSNKHRLQIITEYCFGWAVAFMLLSVIRGSGTTELGSVQFDFLTAILFSMLLGAVFGSISGYAQILTEERIYKKISLKNLIILKFVFALSLLITLVLVSYFIIILFFNINVGLVEFFIEPGSFAIYLYILMVEAFMFILRLVNLMLGRNNLRKLLYGRFYNPREEERIFMFLDLRSSTKLAEKLGHIKYSMLIQDCFYDLGVVAENGAEIYQYVGDEVILTWELMDGLKNHNCINAYYNFTNQLAKKNDYYLDKYNCKPFFKAGANSGIVTVTEVGRYKKEIAYHGDTINTAARIQAKCNYFDQGLLISKNLKDKITNSRFNFNELGSIALKGKEQQVAIYSVNNLIISKSQKP